MSAQTTSQATIKGGSAMIFITDMARAVAFYTGILGLRLQYQAGRSFRNDRRRRWAIAGSAPPSKSAAAPGTAQVVETLQSRGVRFQQHGQNPIADDGAVKLAFFSDPDGTALYLCETGQPP